MARTQIEKRETSNNELQKPHQMLEDIFFHERAMISDSKTVLSYERRKRQNVNPLALASLWRCIN